MKNPPKIVLIYNEQLVGHTKSGFRYIINNILFGKIKYFLRVSSPSHAEENHVQSTTLTKMVNDGLVLKLSCCVDRKV